MNFWQDNQWFYGIYFVCVLGDGDYINTVGFKISPKEKTWALTNSKAENLRPRKMNI